MSFPFFSFGKGDPLQNSALFPSATAVWVPEGLYSVAGMTISVELKVAVFGQPPPRLFVQFRLVRVFCFFVQMV